MILIGESINVMSKTLGPALRERNPKPVQDMALAELKGGVDYLDLNIGPARRGGDELMKWVVNTVQAVTDKPLSLDTTNPVAMEAGLRVCQSKALVNSVSLQPDRLAAGLPLVKKYNASMIGLLWGKDGMPRDANERCLHTVDLVYQASEMGISNEDIWIDPEEEKFPGDGNDRDEEKQPERGERVYDMRTVNFFRLDLFSGERFVVLD